MNRIEIPGMLETSWKADYEKIGFGYHSIDGDYFQQGAAYVFEEKEIQALFSATKELGQMALSFVADEVEAGDYRHYGFTDHEKSQIESSWKSDSPSVYGRFDFLPTPKGDWKMLEFNADTPTCLLEAAVVQWDWLEQLARLRNIGEVPCAYLDQFNSIHEDLIETWQGIRTHMPMDPERPRIHFAYAGGAHLVGDVANLHYMADLAYQAGYDVSIMQMENIGHDPNVGFLDENDEPIRYLFKLYPWEFMSSDEFNQYISGRYDPPGAFSPCIIEPAWKRILSNKVFLPRIWSKHRGHPNLLQSFLEDSASVNPRFGKWIRKPRLAREGWNVSVIEDGIVNKPEQFEPGYDTNGYIIQEYVNGPKFGDRVPVFGSWITGKEMFPSGLGVREMKGGRQITNDSGLFVPHYFKGS